MVWINTIKTDDGFDYTVGQLVIAHASWVKHPHPSGGWLVQVTHMHPASGELFGPPPMPLKQVTAYLHAVTREKQRPL